MPNPFEDIEVAARYDDFYKEEAGKIYDELEKAAIKELLADCHIERVLEVGCGTGHWTEFFSGIGYRILAIDPSEAMLNIAEKKDIKNAEFIKADALTFTTIEVFDAVIFITSLEFMDDPQGAFENCIKYVRPGGCAIIGVLNDESPLGKARKERKSIYSDAHFYTQEELEKFLGKYGKLKIIQAAFAAPDEIDRAYEIEKIRRDRNERTGNFIAARVDLMQSYKQTKKIF